MLEKDHSHVSNLGAARKQSILSIDWNAPRTTREEKGTNQPSQEKSQRNATYQNTTIAWHTHTPAAPFPVSHPSTRRPDQIANHKSLPSIQLSSIPAIIERLAMHANPALSPWYRERTTQTPFPSRGHDTWAERRKILTMPTRPRFHLSKYKQAAPHAWSWKLQCLVWWERERPSFSFDRCCDSKNQNLVLAGFSLT